MLFRSVVNNPSGVCESSSGGIPIAQAVMQECDYDKEESRMEFVLEEIEKETRSRMMKAAFAINKDERKELLAARTRMLKVERFLARKGMSINEVDKEDILETSRINVGLNSSASFISGRDEFGLPIFTKEKSGRILEEPKAKDKGIMPIIQPILKKSANEKVSAVSNQEKLESDGGKPSPVIPNPFVDKMKAKIDDAKPMGGPEPGAQKKSWSDVVNEGPKNDLVFDFVPLSKGNKMVSPPIDVLKMGNAKLKTSIIGSFSKGVVSFTKIANFAHKNWDVLGLEHISQKDNRTFIFRFKLVVNMNRVLARGTWYVERKPMIVHAWGTIPGQVLTMPLWVKFERIPDS